MSTHVALGFARRVYKSQAKGSAAAQASAEDAGTVCSGGLTPRRAAAQRAKPRRLEAPTRGFVSGSGEGADAADVDCPPWAKVATL